MGYKRNGLENTIDVAIIPMKIVFSVIFKGFIIVGFREIFKKCCMLFGFSD
jgi:hypothetical protein